MSILSFAIPVDAAISAAPSCFKTIFAGAAGSIIPPTTPGVAAFVLFDAAFVLLFVVVVASGGSSLSIT